jgi:hypothetical protein
VKPITEFHSAKRNTDGHKGTCIECCRLYPKEHPEKTKEYQKKAREKQKNDPEKKKRMNDYAREWQKANYHRKKPRSEKQRQRDHERTTTQEYRDSRIQYRLNNLDWILPKERERTRKSALIPENRIKRALRARLKTLLQRSNGSKSDKTIVLIGCTMPFLRTYIESLWKEGMSWKNYGKNRDNWVIDHIRPCASFDLNDPAQQRECFHYTNLQPLWFYENAKKGDKYDSK